MIQYVTPLVIQVFLGCVLFALIFFSFTVSRPARLFWFLGAGLWLGLQGWLAFRGFYQVTDTLPPRMLLAVGPPLLLVIGMMVIPAGRRVSDRLNLKVLTWLSLVRIPVEWVLFELFLDGKIPQLLTVEGRNLDILSGISVPLVAWWAFRLPNPNKSLLFWWNLACLGLLLNVMIHGILSAPTPLQQLAFEQPNIAMLYFPFVWLPAFIVPLILYAHLAAMRQCLQKP